MTIYQEKYGFVYIWFDRKHYRYYIGSHWGTENDGYICSSRMMRQAYNRRPDDFKRRILKSFITNRQELLIEEERWLKMIDPNKTTPKNTTIESRSNVRYYNIKLGTQNQWWSKDENRKTIGQKISAAKKGKSLPCSPEKAKAISEAKKKKFAERGGISEEHKLALQVAARARNHKHTAEWKEENSRRMKEQWTLNTSRRQAVSEAAKKRWEEYRKTKQRLYV